jgi:hypothetical protein
MSYFPIKNFKLVNFEKSKTKNKKYDAILQNKETKKLGRVPFGDNRYEHFKDSTPLKLYSHLNHNDKKRQQSYIARHSVYIKTGYYSPGFFSMKYLW